MGPAVFWGAPAMKFAVAVAASIIPATVFAMRFCCSPWVTLSLLAALSVGSAQLMYWIVTSCSSASTSSVVGIVGRGGKS